MLSLYCISDGWGRWRDCWVHQCKKQQWDIAVSWQPEAFFDVPSLQRTISTTVCQWYYSSVTLMQTCFNYDSIVVCAAVRSLLLYLFCSMLLSVISWVISVSSLKYRRRIRNCCVCVCDFSDILCVNQRVVVGVARQQSHRRSGMANLRSVGAIP